MNYEKRLIMYSRSYGCPFVATARRVLNEHKIEYQEILIDQDTQARQRVVEWTGFESVPTFVVAHPGDVMPIEPPSYLEKGATPRGVDRGAMLTEPSANQFKEWLQKHGFIE